MPAEIFSPAEIRAIAAKNPLRQYPGIRKGRDRLLPFAQPQIRTRLSFPTDARFFVAGNCYGRNLEKALARAGRTFLSSPSDLDLPGTAKQQYTRYNIFNLDVSTNEVIWANDPNAQPADDALIKVGDEWVDMQIHWTFAHEESQAKEFRRIYNKSYAGIADADVVILCSSGIEQWFDRETGLYLNGMPTARMDALYPGRFEFHRLDIEASAQTLRRAIDVVLQNTKVAPIILVTVSPVQQPLVYGSNDALIEQFLAKSYLRAAAEQVCQDYAEVEYLPSLEFALLSDFDYAYSAQSLHHSSQGLANRLVAEMLMRYEGATPGYHALYAIGQAEALITAGESHQAVTIVEESIRAGALMSFKLDFQYSQALVKAGRHKDAMAWLLDRMEATSGEEQDLIFRQVTNLVRSYGNQGDLDRLLAQADRMQIDDELIDAIKIAVTSRSAAETSSAVDVGPVGEIIAAFKALRHDEVISLCDALFDDPVTSLAALERALPMLMRSLMSAGLHKTAIDRLYEIVRRQDTPHPRWTALMVNLAVSHADEEIIDRILGMRDKLRESVTSLEPLERRRLMLSRRNKHELDRV